jgi:hypothetical protein
MEGQGPEEGCIRESAGQIISIRVSAFLDDALAQEVVVDNWCSRGKSCSFIHTYSNVDKRSLHNAINVLLLAHNNLFYR